MFVYVESASSGNHRAGAPGKGGKLCGKFLFIGGDVFLMPFCRYSLQVIVNLFLVNHDVRFSPYVRIEGTPSVGVTGGFPQVFQIAGIFELRHFPVLEVCRPQFFFIFRLS